MVQTEQQYICIHQCLLAVLEGKENEIPSREIHSNDGYDGTIRNSGQKCLRACPFQINFLVTSCSLQIFVSFQMTKESQNLECKQRPSCVFLERIANKSMR